LAEAGDLGGDKSDPATYQWVAPSRRDILLPHLPWIILIFTLIISLRRDRRTYAILIPLLFCEIIVQIINTIFRITHVEVFIEGFYFLVNPIVLSCAVILLVPEIFKHSRAVFAFLRTLLIFWGMGILSLLLIKNEIRSEWTFMLVLYGMATLNLVLSILISRMFVRKKFKLIRFLPALFISQFVIMILFFLVFMAIISLVQGIPSDQLFQIILQIVIVSLILSLILFAFALPYLIFSLKNHFYRERLALILRIPGIQPQAPAPEEKQIPD